MIQRRACCKISASPSPSWLPSICSDTLLVLGGGDYAGVNFSTIRDRCWGPNWMRPAVHRGNDSCVYHLLMYSLEQSTTNTSHRILDNTCARHIERDISQFDKYNSTTKAPLIYKSHPHPSSSPSNFPLQTVLDTIPSEQRKASMYPYKSVDPFHKKQASQKETP